MLVETARTSLAWHPPQVSGATRRSPGLTNLTYSADSFSHFVYRRSRAARRRSWGSRGCTCAFSFTASYSGELMAAPGATATAALPPWQSVQPSRTVFVGCMVGSSVEVWQEIHPADLRSASCCDCPSNAASG